MSPDRRPLFRFAAAALVPGLALFLLVLVPTATTPDLQAHAAPHATPDLRALHAPHASPRVAPRPMPDPGPPLALARLRYGGGDWYANPTSLPNLARAIREDLGLDMRDRDVVVEPLDPELRDHPFLHMTGHGAVDFTSEEAAALRAHLEDGGFLHADDNYGMDAAFREAMALVFPDRELVPIPPDHPVFHMVHSLPEGLPKIHEHDGEPPSAWGIFVDGRLAVFYSHESDLGNGWEDPEVHEVPEPLRRQALQMGVNLFAWALAARSP